MGCGGVVPRKNNWGKNESLTRKKSCTGVARNRRVDYRIPGIPASSSSQDASVCVCGGGGC